MKNTRTNGTGLQRIMRTAIAAVALATCFAGSLASAAPTSACVPDDLQVIRSPLPPLEAAPSIFEATTPSIFE